MNFILNHAKLVIVTIAALVLIGYKTTERLAIDVFPDIPMPRVTIQTEAGGLTAEEVEQRITIPIESAVGGIPGVSVVRSSSSGGLSFVWVDFDWSTDLSKARFDVFERLSRAELPKEASTEIAPTVSVTGEIMLAALTKADESELDSLVLREKAEYDLRNRLLSIPGIGEVAVTGGRLPECRVEADPHVLAERGISFADLVSAAERSRTYASAGYLADHKGEEIPLRQLAYVNDIRQIAALPIFPSRPLRISDVASVSIAGAPRRGSASYNGKDAVVLSIQKVPGGNTLMLTKRVENALTQFASRNPGIEVHSNAYRQADFINVSVKGGKEVLRDAALVVALVLALTLLRLRTLLLVLLALPVSALLGVLLMPSLGLGVNVMTIGGLAVAAGDVVDAAIIFTEVIWRRLGENAALEVPRPTKEVIIEATRSVLPGVLFSTTIVVLVFLPLVFLEGLEGCFFKPLALSYLAVFTMSFVVAVTLVPALSLLLWRNPKASTESGRSFAANILKAVYRPFLSLSLKIPAVVLFLAILLCGSAFYMATGFGSSFLPPFKEDSYNVALSLPPGASLSESERVAEGAVESLKAIDGVLSVTRRTGRAERDQHAEPVSSSEYVIRVDLNADTEKIKEEIRSLLGEIPGTSVLVGYPIAHRISAVLSGTEAELAVNIYGEDQAKLRAAVNAVKEELEEIDSIVDVRANREVMVKTLRIDYDLNKLSAAGLSLKDAGDQVAAAFNGYEAGEIREGLLRRSIMIRLKGIDEADIETVKDFHLAGANGEYVHLEDVALVVPENASNLLLREGGRRKALISANPAPNANIGAVVKELEHHLKPIVDKFGVSIEYGGSYEARESAAKRLAMMGVLLFIIIAALVFFALKNLSATMIALLNLPLGLAGGILAVKLGGGVISVSSLVGFVTVSGFTLRNGLLLLNRYDELMKAGKDKRTAIYERSLARMLPIIMTSLTTVIGLIPIILAGEKPGGELLSPLALVQFGGIIGAMLLTLIVIPAAKRVLPVALLLLMLVGCKSYEPSPIEWKEQILDSKTLTVNSLEDVSTYVLLANPEIRKARAEWSGQTVIAENTGYWDDPTLDADFARVLKGGSNPNLGGLNLSVSIPLSGARRKDSEAATQKRLALLAEELSTGHIQGYEAQKAALNYLYAKKMTAKIAARLENRGLSEVENQVAKLTEVGELSITELEDIKRLRRDLSRKLAEAKANEEEARAELLNILGLSADTEILLSDTLDEFEEKELPVPDPMKLVDYRSVVAKRLLFETSELKLDAEIRRQYPELKLGPAFSYEDGENRLGLIAGIDIPIWNRNRLAISEAEAERENAKIAALEEWRQVVRNTFAAIKAYKILKDVPNFETTSPETLKSLLEVGELKPNEYLAQDAATFEEELAQAEFKLKRHLAYLEMEKYLK
ncbi:MAG: efflux RND transporter permease subunit [Kiritimatiellae bacterium]|nr:efflux RND transporter permease subunit [Kiritimatiellia bacterium]